MSPSFSFKKMWGEKFNMDSVRTLSLWTVYGDTEMLIYNISKHNENINRG